jgi:hypothetical protein
VNLGGSPAPASATANRTSRLEVGRNIELMWPTGATLFPTGTLKNVRTEMGLRILAYNLKRVIAILGVTP